jgi:hypothetical protein
MLVPPDVLAGGSGSVLSLTPPVGAFCGPGKTLIHRLTGIDAGGAMRLRLVPKGLELKGWTTLGA